ncbi:MAG: SDR family oxidoreductase, partial [Caldisericaceae bacterium]|nr:SDR family oxidoreductase [Caldisericaceae bacterium]
MTLNCALVTGAARGIGKCITSKLLDHGYTVGMIDINASELEQSAEELAEQWQVLLYHGDIKNENFVKFVLEDFISQTDRLDLLVNNAAISKNKSIEELTLAEWNEVLQTNLTAPFLLAKYAAPHLKKSHGQIINIASTRALMSEANTEAYSSSKGGLLSLTHALAVSLGPEVRVNAISPGWIDTREWLNSEKELLPPLTPENHLQHPAGRVGKP